MLHILYIFEVSPALRLDVLFYVEYKSAYDFKRYFVEYYLMLEFDTYFLKVYLMILIINSFLIFSAAKVAHIFDDLKLLFSRH